MSTQIRISEKQKGFLEKNRKYSRESYSDIFNRVCNVEKSRNKLCKKWEVKNEDR